MRSAGIVRDGVMRFLPGKKTGGPHQYLAFIAIGQFNINARKRYPY